WHYMLDDFLADTRTGHNIVATVFVQANSMYRDAGPVEMRPVGVTEFVNGMAAICASGYCRKTRGAAGRVADRALRVGHRGEAAPSRGWPRLCVPPAIDSAAFAMPRRGMPILHSSIRPIRHRPGCSAIRRFAKDSRSSAVWDSRSMLWFFTRNLTMSRTLPVH